MASSLAQSGLARIPGFAGTIRIGGDIHYQRKTWDAIASTVEFSLPFDVETFVELLPLETKIVDYGCGYGRISRTLKDIGFMNVVGYDTSQGMIERGMIESPDLDLRHSESYVLPEAPGTFGAAIVTAVLTSLPDETLRLLVWEEIARLLHPEGLLVLSEFLHDERRQYDANGCFFSRLGVRMKHFRESEIRSMLHKWEISRFRCGEAKSLSGTNVPVVYVYAHSSPYVAKGRKE